MCYSASTGPAYPALRLSFPVVRPGELMRTRLINTGSTIRAIVICAVMALAACAVGTPTPLSHTMTILTVPPTVKGTLLPTSTPEPTEPSTAYDRLAFVNEEGIHLVSPDGSDLVSLVVFSGQFSIEKISWSSDGQRLAYVTYADCSVTECSLPDANTTLYVVNADGTAHHQVTSWQSRGAPSDLSWKWSPDSRYILIYRISDTHGCFYSVRNVETAQTVCQYRFTGYLLLMMSTTRRRTAIRLGCPMTNGGLCATILSWIHGITCGDCGKDR
jgi:hypothetical protein